MNMKTKKRTTQYSKTPPKERLPKWIKPTLGRVSQLEKVQSLVKRYKLNTICEEGRCPNRGECYASGTATFLLGGSICTRSCAFCQVDKGTKPQDISLQESKKVANAVALLGLKYVVLTSVARDDLDDHGASIFTSTIFEIRDLIPDISIEVLTPDFWGGHLNYQEAKRAQKMRLETVLSAKPVCFNHNLETVERLQREVRRGATYEHSLGLLETARNIDPSIPTKSGLMLGLGESKLEVLKTMDDLRKVDCQQITIGQYLRPSLAHIPVQHYWEPKDFLYFGEYAKTIGFKKVNSGPLVRSSYHASDN